MAEFHEFPKVRYTNDGQPVHFADQAAEDDYDGETFDLPNGDNHAVDYEAKSAFHDSGAKASNPGYTFEEYPKWVGDKIVNNREEEGALSTIEEPEVEKEPKKASAGKWNKKASAGKGNKKGAKAAKDADDLL